MTQEEAIKELQDNIAYLKYEGYAGIENTADDKLAKATEMAIQSLKERHRQEQTFEWCMDCKEYDREHHCCHRFTKVIGTTIHDARAEMANQIIEQIDKLYQEPFYLVPKDDYLDLFKKIITDWRDEKGPWAERRTDDC